MDLTRYISRECCRSARVITTAVIKFILGVSKVDSTAGCIALISDEEALLVVGALMPSLWNGYMARAKSAHHQNVQAEKDPTRLARAADCGMWLADTWQERNAHITKRYNQGRTRQGSPVRPRSDALRSVCHNQCLKPRIQECAIRPFHIRCTGD